MRRPADQMRRAQLFEMRDSLLRELLDAVLFRIGRNHFEIAALAEGKQRVARATTRMNTAKRSAYAGMLLDKVDAAIQVVTTKENVIEQ